MSVRYTRTAIVLHWLIALVIFAQIPLGWYLDEIPRRDAGAQLVREPAQVHRHDSWRGDRFPRMLALVPSTAGAA